MTTTDETSTMAGESALILRRGGAGDADTMLALFDDAVRWLVRRGRAQQWGTAPFSAIPQRVQQVRGWAQAGDLRIAERDGIMVGAMALGRAPGYAPPSPVPELYVTGLVSRRAPAGRGAGAALLRMAADEALARHKTRLRVDCWAGGDGELVRYYTAAGFTPTTELRIDDWHGQVLEMALTEHSVSWTNGAGHAGPGLATDG